MEKRRDITSDEPMKLYDTYYYQPNLFADPCFFDICIDEQRKVIHILDIGTFATSVTNCVSRKMQRDLLDHYFTRIESIDIDIDNWKWLLYGTDCILAEYVNGGFVGWSLDRIAPDNLTLVRMKKIWGDG